MALPESVRVDRGVSFGFEVDLTVIKEQCYKCGLGQRAQTYNGKAVLMITAFKTLIDSPY